MTEHRELTNDAGSSKLTGVSLAFDREKLLQGILRINRLVVTCAETEVLLKEILDEVVASLGFDRGIIRLLDETGQFLEAKVVKNYSPEEMEAVFSKPLNIAEDDCLPVRAVRRSEVIAIDDVQRALEQITAIDRRLIQIERCGSVISVPLKMDNETIGTISVWKNVKTPFLPEDIDLILTFAAQISVVIKNSRLLEANAQKIAKLLILQKAVSAMNVDIRQKEAIRKVTMDAVFAITEADLVLVYLWDIQKERVDVDDVQERNMAIARERWLGLAAMAKSLKNPIFLEKSDHLSLFPENSAEIIIPLNYPRRYQGFLYATKKKGLFSVDDFNLLEILVQNATTAYDNARMHKRASAEALTLKDEVATLKQREDILLGFHNIIGNSPEIQNIFSLIERIAVHDTSVLITGESGTGKELVSRAIHRQSLRTDKSFVEINCSAIPSSLLESELLGHEAGAFTDARKRKVGLIEHASGGTLLLDEIGEMDMPLQAKFLRVLEDGFIRRIGGLERIPIDVRFVFATNRDLAKMVEEGLFREDLYYRINVVPIRLPPLRDRNEDIMLLAENFLAEFNKKFYRNIKGFKSGARAALLRYGWPGNVRELRNVVERAIILKKSGDSIGLSDLPLEVTKSVTRGAVPSIAGLETLLEESPSLHGATFKEITTRMPLEIKAKLLGEALTQSGGNKTRAAKILGISRYQIMREQKKISTATP